MKSTVAQFIKRFYMDFGLIVLLIFIILGILGYFQLNQTIQSAATYKISDISTAFTSTSKYLIFTSLIFGIIIISGLFYLMRYWTDKPMFLLKNVMDTLVEKDFPSLRTAMIGLTKGDFTISPAILAEPIPLSENDNLNSYINSFNVVIQSLKRTVEEFEKVISTPCLRLCYVGADSYLEGQRCGQEMMKLLGNKGQVAIATSSFSSTGAQLRRNGFENYLRENDSKIKIVRIYENHNSSSLAKTNTEELLKEYPDLSGIYVTQGSTPSIIAKIVVDSGKAKKIKIISHDMLDETMHYIKDGVISATLGQNPFAQGHDPVIHLFNHLVDNWRPTVPRLLTSMDIVTAKNIDLFWDENKGQIQSEAALEKLAKPVDKKVQKTLRIAILGTESSPFWIPVKQGVLSASEKLKSSNIHISWICPDQIKSQHYSISQLYANEIERLVSEGYDGIATRVVDQHLVPTINQAVKAGVPVITMNNEPTSLANLIYTISSQAEKLIELSYTLTYSISQVSQATTQIKDSMNNISEGAISQNEHVVKTSDILKELLKNINHVNREAEKNADSARNTVDAVLSGTDAMGKTVASMKIIEKSVADSWHIVEELIAHTTRIDLIIDLIDNIATQVNVLGLNASIEATSAGKYGKGFISVADEIRKLAASTTNATQEIIQLINSIKKGVGHVEKVMNIGLSKVKESSGLTGETVSALAKLKDLIELDQKRIELIALSISRMKDFSKQVSDAMKNVASVSEKNNVVVENVNVSTNEMSIKLDSVGVLAKSLESMALAEQELLAKFNLWT